MDWREHKENVSWFSDYELWNNSKIFLNDRNIKPDWISHVAEFSEFHVQRGKKELLIVIGESWAYGETLPGIATALQQYDFKSQINNTFGPITARTLDTDYYQYAIPGNCNMYMFAELDRILNYISTSFNYEKVYVALQMTEPGREAGIIRNFEHHPLAKLYDRDTNINFKDWLAKYDEIFFNIYEETLNKYKQLNLSAVLWKNFCKTNTAKRDYSFKIVETSWIQFSGKCLACDLDMPGFYAIGWFADLQQNYKNIQIDLTWADAELDKISACNKFIKASPLHSQHPSIAGHLLWSNFLTRQARWKNDI
jgi:hypothetical protein